MRSEQPLEPFGRISERTRAGESRRTTLVVFPGALGDFVCFLPTLRALRRRHADHTLVVVAQAAVLPLATRPELADAGVPIESAAVSQLFVAGADLRALLADPRVGGRGSDGRVARVYSWFAADDPVVAANLRALGAGATIRHVPFQLAPHDRRHVARYFLETADCRDAPCVPVLPLRDEEIAAADAFWRAHRLDGGAVLAVHRGGGGRHKRWSDDGYRAVTCWWRERGGRVLEVAGPADPQAPLDPRHVVVRDLSIGDVSAVLGRAGLFVGCDSGVTHLAGAVGLRGVVIFGPTAARRWRPLGGRFVCLRSTGALTPGEPIPVAAASSARVIRTLEVLARAASP
jgi:ADP-heptose:LPS heptosyltransferase